MIRDVVIHLLNEQPLLADLEAVPKPSDTSLICTNLRMLNGQRPIFVDDSASIFVFPMPFVRFVELPPRSLAGLDRTGRPEDDASSLPVPAHPLQVGGERAAAAAAQAAHDDESEIDEDFLKRVRDV